MCCRTLAISNKVTTPMSRGATAVSWRSKISGLHNHSWGTLEVGLHLKVWLQHRYRQLQFEASCFRRGKAGRFNQNVTLFLETYLDEDWNEVMSIEDPCQRKKKSRSSMSVSVPLDGRWSETLRRTVRNNVRSHIWYFAVLDCAKKTENSRKFEYEMTHLNEGGSHFTVETRWTLPSNVLSLVCFVAFSGLFAKRCLAEMTSVGRLHMVIWALVVVVAMQLLAQSLHALHLWRYSYNGTGVRPFEILAEISFILSQLVQSALLLLIGYGYTLIPVDVDPATVLLTFGISAVVHIILVLLIKAEDSADKFHDYEGLAGKTLLALRLASFAVFLWCLKSTMTGAPYRIRGLLSMFAFVGALYFIGPPFLVMLVSVFAPYWRPPILNTSLMLLQIGTAWWLHNQFLSRGEYFKVSELNSSSLPGGTPRSPRTPLESPTRSPQRDKRD
ncbi:unnamed protein product [Durusdinium trenchii]|uniref:GPR180/TMEM145 transmembrane domain-containing protein n=1 Tax=Durusdinium trenchii TaxID=1381693 RepID=A0ABP0SYM9_9DINO